MARFPTLRKTILSLVLAALPAVASGCCAGYEDPQQSQIVSVKPTDTDYRPLIAECMRDDRACEALCEEVLLRQEVIYEPGQVYFTECRIIENNTKEEIHMTYAWPEGCEAGRRPPGLCRPSASDPRSSVGAWLARMAYLEAASVHAFVVIAQELARFGAPEQLVRRSLRAADDEIRHAALMSMMARRYGARPEQPTIVPPAQRDFIDFCIDNAVEGCVRETFGAVVATWQAHAARDPMMREVLAIIARDETGHAELSAAIDAWAMPRLTDAEREQVETARAAAIADVVASASAPVAPELIDIAGVPGPTDAARLVAHVRSALWMSGCD